MNAVYDTQLASWYENMGIVVAFVAPKDTQKPAGVDVFTDNVAIHPGVAAGAMVPAGKWYFNFTPQKGCRNDLVGRDGQKDLCLRGQVTHGAKPESGNAGEPCTADTCPALPKKDGRLTTDIHAAGFTYGQADLGVIGATGIPLVKVGQPVRFWNEDAAANIWHTFTRCKEPCTGPTRINYPIADGGNGHPNDHMDFESMEIGYGLMWEPPRSQVGGNDPYDGQWLQDGLVWQFTPTKPGVYSFYCRIHPGMRGAIKAVK
jgi:plastocyanin